MFNWHLYPYTDINKVNLDWILEILSKLRGGLTGQFIKKKTGEDYDFEWSAPDYPELENKPTINGVTVEGDLTGHDLDLANLDDLFYVTPEMFGAAGDGTTDDTAAWQTAVDTGLSVKATKKNYKCGKIAVTNNIEIDCNGADFVCTDTTLFDFTGNVETTLTGESDYSAGQANYALSGTGYTDYTGFVMLKGDNNFEESRSYYYGGFVGKTENGVLNQAYPIDVTKVGGIDVLIITPITATLTNVGSIKHPDVAGTVKSVSFLYGLNCVVENVNSQNADSYDYILFEKCLNCTAKNLNITMAHGTAGTDSYTVALVDSSFCVLENSILFNRYWHCVTTGGNYLCFHNDVHDCVMDSYSGVAFSDHENACSTIIHDCEISCATIQATATVERLVIKSRVSTGNPCTLVVNHHTDSRLCATTIRNVTFMPENDSTNVGILISAYSQGVSGKTYYIDNIEIEDIYLVGGEVYGRIALNFISSNPDNHTYVMGKVIVANSMLDVYCNTVASATWVNITNYRLIVSDVYSEVTFKSGGSYTTRANIIGANANAIYNYVQVNNCRLRGIQGKFTTLELHGVRVQNSMSKVSVLAKNFIATGVELYILNNFWFPTDATYDLSFITISDLKGYNNKNVWYNVYAKASGVVYYQYWDNGTLTTAQIINENP